MEWLKQIFTKKHKATFHMKSGATITTTCTELSLKKRDNDLVGYTIYGAPVNALFYVRLDDVSAITLEQ
jgi:hypothetical protein